MQNEIEKKVSPQRAIANYCKGCTYDPKDAGAWWDQVEACTIVRCELYNHRPRSKAHREAQREAYLAGLTMEQRVQAGIVARERSERLKALRLAKQEA